MLTRKRQKYREPRNDYKKRIQSFYKNVTAELVKFFKFKSLTVTRLCLHRECLESRDRPNTFTTLRMHRAIIDALLESLRIVHGVNNERMHVEHLCMNSVALFNDIMPILEVDWLGRIFLLECDNRRWDTFLGTHPITQTDQWKSSYWFFSSMAVKIERSLANFSHFGYCNMDIAYELIDLDLEELKADLFRNPDLCHFRIRGDDDLTPNERDQINQRLGTQTGVWTEFIYPENANLKLWIRVFRGTVWFKGPRHSEKVGMDEANEPD
ncbi:hypothetical protein CAEBREN_24104 [Caenorhabditis brenneri]|uniref:DUF38 domain-containing protein n=1 Tax=Caenorhabditis brenneri TaxID=135651 RepID=G0MY62_CAEBE|nr:hypothetical protein CAEBREN_24104 [Caenorhabditis brenneri]